MSRDLALAERAAVAEHSCVLAAFDNAAPGMAIVDERGRVVAANRRMALLARAQKASLGPGAEFAGIFDLPTDTVAKSRFLANVSHELRTPLNAIIGFSEIVAGEILGPGVNRKYRDYASNIVESARHLLDIINSVLDLAKNDAGKLRVADESVELNDIVEGCVRLVHEQCERAQLSLEVQPWHEPLRVNADSTKLRQVFLNLLSNAIKFTEPEGAISIAVEPVDAERVTVNIGDTGIGMAPEEIPIALAPFEQVDNKLARRYQGTGLGLPLAKALVELQGGDLAISSEPGKGTLVRVSLRRHLPAANELNAAHPV